MRRSPRINLLLTRGGLNKTVASVMGAVEKDSGGRTKGACGTVCALLKQALVERGISSEAFYIKSGNFDHWVLRVRTLLEEYVVDPTVRQFFLSESDAPKVFIGTKGEYIALHKGKRSSFSLSFIYYGLIQKKRGLQTPYEDWLRFIH